MRPLRLLDLFCCEGGSAKGYADAGFEVIGVNIRRRRQYPYPLIVANVLDLDPKFLAWFDAIHASPPCQFGTALNNDKSKHLNLIPQTRKMLRASGKPYIIENVMKVAEADHLQDWISLTGTMFGNGMTTSKGRHYVLERERAFETNWPLVRPADPGACGHPIANVFGGHLRCRDAEHRTGKGTGRTVDFPGEDRPALARQLMGMEWATMQGMSEAIPPSFTEEIGLQLMHYLRAA
jgi:DNA (cytosine-5)-methyltransferase 1